MTAVGPGPTAVTVAGLDLKVNRHTARPRSDARAWAAIARASIPALLRSSNLNLVRPGLGREASNLHFQAGHLQASRCRGPRRQPAGPTPGRQWPRRRRPARRLRWPAGRPGPRAVGGARGRVQQRDGDSAAEPGIHGGVTGGLRLGPAWQTSLSLTRWDRDPLPTATTVSGTVALPASLAAPSARPECRTRTLDICRWVAARLGRGHRRAGPPAGHGCGASDGAQCGRSAAALPRADSDAARGPASGPWRWVSPRSGPGPPE